AARRVGVVLAMNDKKRPALRALLTGKNMGLNLKGCMAGIKSGALLAFRFMLPGSRTVARRQDPVDASRSAREVGDGRNFLAEIVHGLAVFPSEDAHEIQEEGRLGRGH